MTVSRRTFGRTVGGMLVALGLAMAPVLVQRPAYAQSNDAATITAHIETFRAAMLAKETAKLDPLMAANLNYGHSAGVIENKAEFLKAVADRKANMKSLKYSDIKVQVDGNTAIARHTWESESELDGKQTQTKIGVLQVWQKQADGKWQIYARQAFRL